VSSPSSTSITRRHSLAVSGLPCNSKAGVPAPLRKTRVDNGSCGNLTRSSTITKLAYYMVSLVC
jgi:hypothetical protein